MKYENLETAAMLANRINELNNLLGISGFKILPDHKQNIDFGRQIRHCSSCANQEDERMRAAYEKADLIIRDGLIKNMQEAQNVMKKCLQDLGAEF